MYLAACFFCKFISIFYSRTRSAKLGKILLGRYENITNDNKLLIDIGYRLGSKFYDS